MPKESRYLGRHNLELKTILAKNTGEFKYRTPRRTIRLLLEPLNGLSKSTCGSRIIGWRDFVLKATSVSPIRGFSST